MLLPMQTASRPGWQISGFHGPRPKPTSSNERGVRPAIASGRTPGTAPLLRLLDCEGCIAGTLGLADPDHYFKLRGDSDGGFRLALTSTNSVAGLQVIKSHIGPDEDGIDPADILLTTSTLLADPAILNLIVGAGWYLVRVYRFFSNSVDYRLELSLCSASPAVSRAPIVDPAESNGITGLEDRAAPTTETAGNANDEVGEGQKPPLEDQIEPRPHILIPEQGMFVE
jgi:hypothetical protein